MTSCRETLCTHVCNVWFACCSSTPCWVSSGRSESSLICLLRCFALFRGCSSTFLAPLPTDLAPLPSTLIALPKVLQQASSFNVKPLLHGFTCKSASQDLKYEQACLPHGRTPRHPLFHTLLLGYVRHAASCRGQCLEVSAFGCIPRSNHDQVRVTKVGPVMLSTAGRQPWAHLQISDRQLQKAWGQTKRALLCHCGFEARRKRPCLEVEREGEPLTKFSEMGLSCDTSYGAGDSCWSA